MTQKIFDTDNDEDMALLWSILPDNATSIEKTDMGVSFFDDNGLGRVICGIVVNFHDKTEITRPTQEATEADIGKLCRFSLSEKARCSISLTEENDAFGILTEINNNGTQTLYLRDKDVWFNHCRRLTKKEIEELC